MAAEDAGSLARGRAEAAAHKWPALRKWVPHSHDNGEKVVPDLNSWFRDGSDPPLPPYTSWDT